MQVANGDCESELSAPFAFSTNSLELGWLGSIQIYPNPSDGRIFIKAISKESKTVRLKIFNATAQEVIPAKEKLIGTTWNEELDLSHLPEGLYFLQISDGSHVYQERIVIQKTY